LLPPLKKTLADYFIGGRKGSLAAFLNVFGYVGKIENSLSSSEMHVFSTNSARNKLPVSAHYDIELLEQILKLRRDGKISVETIKHGNFFLYVVKNASQRKPEIEDIEEGVEGIRIRTKPDGTIRI
jgi:hypothetical protein